MDSVTTRQSRRQVIKFVLGSAVSGMTLASIADQASAGRMWCRLDPTFAVDGLIGNVYVSGELDTTYDTTGPIKLVFRTPVGCKVQLLFEDAGFGQGYSISYESTTRLIKTAREIQIEVDVTVPARTSKLPVLAEFVPDGTIKVADRKTGTTNQMIRVKTGLNRA